MKNNHIPYTYKITHKTSGEWYYGVRYAKNCNPSDFWVTYFTSSNIIAEIIKNEGVDSFSFEIRKTFNNKTDAIRLEHKVLTKILNSPLCLNKSAWPAVSRETTNKSHQTKLKIKDNGLNTYQLAALKWKEKSILIEETSGLTYGELKRIKQNIILDKNNTRHIKKPHMSGDKNPSCNPIIALKIKNALKEGYASGRLIPTFKGRTHTKEVLEYQSFIKHGDKNPAFGTIWITNGSLNKRVKSNNPIPLDWYTGRTLSKEHIQNAKDSSTLTKPFMSIIITKKSYNKGNAYIAFPELKPYFV